MQKISKYLIFYILFLPFSLAGQELTLSGLIQSDNQKTVASKYNGFVEKVYVQEGDFIKKGDRLLKIDSQELETTKSQLLLSISQTRLNYNTLQHEYLKIKKDYERYKKLFEKQMVSKTFFEEVSLKKQRLENSLMISQKEISQLQSQLEKINKEFSYLDITASTNALVIKKSISEGELTTVSKPLLTLCDIKDLVIYLDVGESHLKQFHTAKELTVFVESMGVSLGAKLEAILPNVDPTSGNFRVKIALNKTEHQILPGMYAQVLVK